MYGSRDARDPRGALLREPQRAFGALGGARGSLHVRFSLHG